MYDGYVVAAAGGVVVDMWTLLSVFSDSLLEMLACPWRKWGEGKLYA